MYPLVTPSLTLSDLAKHWTRHFPERPPQQEVFDYLLQAVWSNELLPQRKDGSSVSVAELLRMVQQAGSTSGHPRIFVYDDPARPPAELETLPDGNVKIYVGKSVYLPTDESRWTPDVVSEACAILASCGLADVQRQF